MRKPAPPTPTELNTETPVTQDFLKRASARAFIMGTIAAILERGGTKELLRRCPLTSTDIASTMPDPQQQLFNQCITPWRVECTIPTEILVTWIETGEQELLPTNLGARDKIKENEASLEILYQGIPRTH